MIINISREKSRLLCRKKSFNTYHRMLQDPRKSMNLVDGSAFHKGVAHGLATRDWVGAQEVAVAQFEEDRQGVVTLPELEFQMTDHKEMIAVMIKCYQDAFQDQGIQVIQPECEFDIPLEGTEHNCIWLHHWEQDKETPNLYHDKWGPPSPDTILDRRVHSPHSAPNSPHHQCPCYVPHHFVGKTDAVVVWMNNIWLLEHKTTAILGEQFWNQWRLDIQPTGYIYGIQKALGTKVSGFILNAIWKPSEAQVSAWNKKRKYGPPQDPKDYIKYEREAFLRSQEDLDRFERELTELCNDWERDIVRGSFPMSPLAGICNQYNHQCEFHSMCTCHDQASEIEALGQRQGDYVDIKTLKLSGLKVEEKPIEYPDRTTETDGK